MKQKMQNQPEDGTYNDSGIEWNNDGFFPGNQWGSQDGSEPSILCNPDWVKHDPLYSKDYCSSPIGRLANCWSVEEQEILEAGMEKYAFLQGTCRYAAISLHLPNKTVRDVALRCRWTLMGRENGTMEPSAGLVSDTNKLVQNHDLDGAIRNLLEENCLLLSLIKYNLASHQVEGNKELFVKLFMNITRLSNLLNGCPDEEATRKMPPVTDLLDERLFSAFADQMGTRGSLCQRY